MKAGRFLAIAGLMTLMLTTLATAGQTRVGLLEHIKKGELFCPSTTRTFSNIIPKSGQCYGLVIAHNALGTFPASGSSGAMIAPCQTILNSLLADWQATRVLFATYGPQMELNPIIRALGPDLYFATWSLGLAAICKENHVWQMASIIIWAVETTAVNTHVPLGTARSLPMFILVVRF